MIDYGYGVYLRRPDKTLDYWKMLNWRNDKRIWRWCRQHEPLRLGDHESWFNRIGTDKTLSMFVIENEKHESLGVCGLTDIDYFNSRAEFSLYIAPDHWRNGYARRALKTLLEHGFYDLGLNLIYGETFEGNPALDLFLTIGFQKDGIRRQFYYCDGIRLDAHLISLTLYEFETLAPWDKTGWILPQS